MSALPVILAALALAFVLKEVFARVGIPRVVGEIAAGMLLAFPLLHGALFSQGSAETFGLLANMGAILLFFFVGLEIDPRQAKKNLREAFSVSFISTVLTFIVGIYVATTFFGLSLIVAAIVGIALAVNAIAPSIDLLEELGMLKTHVGSIIVTSGAVDDIAEFVLIALILAMLNIAIGQTSVLSFFLNVVFFAIVVVVFKLFVVPWVLRFFAREHSESSVFAAGIMLTLSMAVIADFVGLESFLGALVAGIIVREALKDKIVGTGRVWEAHTLTNSIHTISFGFLVPLFFVWVGLSVDLQSLLTQIPFMLVLLFIAIFVMVAGAVIGVLLNKGTLKEGVLVGFGIVPKGDVELAIATLALSKGIIPQGVFAPIVGTAIITTIVGPVAFKWLLKKWGGELY